ncbi:MAG: Ammonia channel precursor, partial [Verrucomicrobiota bacterium]
MNSLLRTLTILALAAAPYWATAAESAPAPAAAPAAEAAKTPPPPPAPTIPTGLTTPAASSTGPGHNGFMMICAALVLFMTLPGLFLFYGGLVRSKNVLSVVAQCFGL